MTDFSPRFESFKTVYDSGTPQIIGRTLVADLDTPVSAFMKLGMDAPYAFLLESVQGGETRGRYSIIGLKPDIIWRCNGAKAELNEQADQFPEKFTAEDTPPLASLRNLLTRTRLGLIGFAFDKKNMNVGSSRA